MNEKPLIICLTPVKNEGWILDTFLKCTCLWADHIIIADQMSTDGSREIAKRYPKVILINNPLETYNEIERQKLLINKARSINGKKLLVTLDADEFFSSNFLKTEEWDAMLNGQPGDSFAFRWINIIPGYNKGWVTRHFVWSLIDDGFEHSGSFIHSPRLPISDKNKIKYFENIKVLHFQYTNWPRMESKHRYYQCLERINYPAKRSIDLYRMYHHMYSVRSEDLIELDEKLFDEYEKIGIEMRKKPSEKETYWFDKEILELFSNYGVKMFRKESIWNVDWNKIAYELNFSNNVNFKDPRNIFDKLIHLYLKYTQSIKDKKIVRRIDSIINRVW